MYLIAIIAGAALVFFILVCVYEQHHFGVTHIAIADERIPDCLRGKRLLQLTDLHCASYGTGNERLLRAIDDIKPDAVVITGDMVTRYDDGNTEVAEELLRRLAKRYDVYYALGNHETAIRELGLFDIYKEKIESFGVRFLINDAVALEFDRESEGLPVHENSRRASGVRLYGLELPIGYYKRNIETELPPVSEYLDKAFGNANDHEYNILLAHDPFFFEKYAGWGANLVLSGHVHGGIIRLPFLGGVMSPRYELFPKYDSGVYKTNGCTMVLSRGIGSHSLPIRFMNKPEIILIGFE